jgi:hypothetical protein
MKGSTVVTLAAVALLVLAGSAAGARSRRLPKGFPYAAEIQATIEYDGTYALTRRSTQPCGTGEGEVKIPLHENESVHFERTLYFSHITVPVATPGELGKAAARLGLKPTVTSPGKIRNDRSSMDLEDELAVPNTESEGCVTAPVNCHWDLAAIPSGILQQINTHDHGFLPVSWSISVLGSNATIAEECPVTTGANELSVLLHEAARLYPSGLQNFPEVTVSRALGGDFHRLQRNRVVEFNIKLNTPASGTGDCARRVGEEESCSDSVTGTAHVRLRRLALYQSKSSYPR